MYRILCRELTQLTQKIGITPKPRFGTWHMCVAQWISLGNETIFSSCANHIH